MKSQVRIFLKKYNFQDEILEKKSLKVPIGGFEIIEINKG